MNSDGKLMMRVWKLHKRALPPWLWWHTGSWSPPYSPNRMQAPKGPFWRLFLLGISKNAPLLDINNNNNNNETVINIVIERLCDSCYGSALCIF